MSNLTKEIKNFIVKWNDKFPIDNWWRKKYNVSFGSEQHLEMDFIKMKLEYEEYKFHKRIEMDNERREFQFVESSEILKGIKTSIKMTKKEIDEEFDNIDLSKFNG